MPQYIGEFFVKQEETPFAKYKDTEWALYFIERHGSLDGGHHKQWLLDQLARLLNGAPVHIVEARWEGGLIEYRVSVGTSEKYTAWVKGMEAGEDGPETYTWEKGVPP